MAASIIHKYTYSTYVLYDTQYSTAVLQSRALLSGTGADFSNFDFLQPFIELDF